jgi:hypothetical protein
MINECGAVGGMRIGRGNRSTRRKAAPVALRPPHRNSQASHNDKVRMLSGKSDASKCEKKKTLLPRVGRADARLYLLRILREACGINTEFQAF